MTCRKAKKLNPLYAGGDLRPRLMEALRAHVGSCPACLEDLAQYREALALLKTAAEAERVPDWTEDEWQALAAGFKPEDQGPNRPGFLARPRWAAALALGAFLGLAVLTMLFRDGTGGRPELAAAAEPSVVSLTLVSQETGLQVVWFLDRNFEWKGDIN